MIANQIADLHYKFQIGEFTMLPGKVLARIPQNFQTETLRIFPRGTFYGRASKAADPVPPLSGNGVVPPFLDVVCYRHRHDLFPGHAPADRRGPPFTLAGA